MRNLLMKICLIVIVTLILGVTFNTSTYASTMSDFMHQGDVFLDKASKTSVIDEDALKNTSTKIYNVLFSIAVVLAVAVGMIIGIQFMVGSVDEKAKIKETLVPYVIGVFVVFGAFGIWKIVVGIGNDVAPSSPIRKCRVEYDEVEGEYNSECLNCGHIYTYENKMQTICTRCMIEFQEHVTPIKYYNKKPYCGYCVYSLDEDDLEKAKCGNCGFKLEK